MENRMLDENSDTCCVCVDHLVEETWVRLYPCGHGLHSACVANWFFQHCQDLLQRRIDGTYRGPIDVKLCPCCRTPWGPAGAPVSVARLGARMEVTNHAISVAYEALVQASAAEAAQIMGPGADVDVEEDTTEQEEMRPADEHRDECVVCHRTLFGGKWMSTEPCGCLMHIQCALESVTADFTIPSHAVNLLEVGCPGCEDEWTPPILFGDYIQEYNVRPVPRLEYEFPALPTSRDTGMVTSYQVEVNCFWVLLIKEMIEQRDVELGMIRRNQHIGQDLARRAYVAKRLNMRELEEKCRLCSQPLACNYWVELGSCHHRFHICCLREQVLTQWDEDIHEFILVCAVCKLNIVFELEEDLVMDYFLWMPLDTPEEHSKYHLDEITFWWDVDEQKKAKIEEGH